MEHPLPSANGTAPPGWLCRAAPAILLLGLVAAQGWLVLHLFGPDHAWQHLLDDTPLVSGRHPLHLYHGFLGACSLRDSGTPCCFDPAFQAGYPKTPVFDGGSRPAELFLLFAGSTCRPAAYKIGVAVCCAAVPVVLALAAWAAGLGASAGCLAAAFGMLVFWGSPCRALLDGGDLDLFLAGLALVLAAAVLLRYHREPGPLAWLGLLLAAGVGCFAQPIFFLGVLLVLLLIWYSSVGTRHDLAWHVGLFAALGGGVAGNLFWLIDWIGYWWVLVPLPTGERRLAHRTLRSFWEAPLWGATADRMLAVALFAGGLLGLLVLNQNKARAAARLLGVGAVGLAFLALLGIAWEPAGRVGAMKLLVPALWFAALPAAFACRKMAGWLRYHLGCPWRAALLGGVCLAGAAWYAGPELATFADRWRGPAPLALGLSPEQQTLVTTLTQHTTTEARILWEDRTGAHSCWTALLPLWTGRYFLGGLDAEAALEYGYAGFVEQRLAGRPVAEWSDADLDEFCRRYNLGWVVCWTPTTQERFRRWSLAEPVAALSEDGQAGSLFALKRPRSFVLKGKARWVSADCRHVALSDV